MQSPARSEKDEERIVIKAVMWDACVLCMPVCVINILALSRRTFVLKQIYSTIIGGAQVCAAVLSEKLDWRSVI